MRVSKFDLIFKCSVRVHHYFFLYFLKLVIEFVCQRSFSFSKVGNERQLAFAFIRANQHARLPPLFGTSTANYQLSLLLQREFN
jgi:hypothetical protein